MSYPSYGEQSLPQLPASRIQSVPPGSSNLFGTQELLGQDTFGNVPQGSEFMTQGQIPIATGQGQLPVSQSGGRPLSPPSVPFATQPLQAQGGISPMSSVNFGAQTLPLHLASNRQVGQSQSQRVHLDGGSNWSQTGSGQGRQLRSLPGERIMQMQPQQDESQWRPEATPSPKAPPPASFTTAAVPQMQAQESRGAGEDDENEYLHNRVQELEQSHQDLQQQLAVARSQRALLAQDQQSQQALGVSASDVAFLEQRVREAEESELRAHGQRANAIQAHDIAVNQINDLEQQIFRTRATQGGQTGTAADNSQRMFELQQQLETAKADQVTAQRLHANAEEEHRVILEDNARALARSQSTQAQLQQQAQGFEGERLDLERRHAEAQREKETQTRIAEDRGAALQQTQGQHSAVQQELDRKASELRNVEDTYQNQLMEERRRAAELQDVLESETRAKEHHAQQSTAKDDQLRDLQNEVTYLKSVETFHKRQEDRHRKEAQRLKRLREEDAPPKPPLRMPLKALEERIMHLACFMMMGVCALPIMGAIATLTDENYMFWLGPTWPWLIIAGCAFVFVLFAVTMQLLLNYAGAEHRSQFTMAFTWATFAALLGVILVPLSLLANKEALNIASTISQGCLTAMPQSEMLVDYSQVLYNIRLSQNCTGATSVEQCKGFSENKYTHYLQYLESDFHCGPLCPESPPPARVVVAPNLFNKPVPTFAPTMQPPPMIGPPLQGALSFLQADNSLVSQRVKLHSHEAAREHAVPASSGVMETALPHMQARKLFSDGTTRMTCYPLIATRLQVLVSTFGGLWYWEGMGLIIISLLTSIYAGLYFALTGQMA